MYGTHKSRGKGKHKFAKAEERRWMPWERPKVEKGVEAQVMKCFELAFEKMAEFPTFRISHLYVCKLSRFQPSPSLQHLVHFVSYPCMYANYAIFNLLLHFLIRSNCGVPRHQLWYQLWSRAILIEFCEPLTGRSFGWICLSRSPCPRFVVRPTGKVGVKLIRTSLGSGWVGRQQTLPVLFAGHLIHYVRYACYQLYITFIHYKMIKKKKESCTTTTSAFSSVISWLTTTVSPESVLNKLMFLVTVKLRPLGKVAVVVKRVARAPIFRLRNQLSISHCWTSFFITVYSFRNLLLWGFRPLNTWLWLAS